jgi:hypothetical protein
LGKQSESQGAKSSEYGGWEMISMLMLHHKLCGFQGHVGGRVVMMKEPVVVVPKFQSFSLHIFSQESQNITVNVRVDHSVRRNKFMVNNPLHVKKNNAHVLC